jgi:DNA repair protein RecO (recombination protein O)
MISKTQGIVLHHFKYDDSSLIATIYTGAYGRKSFLVRGAFKPKSKIRASLFLPLNLVELDLNISSKRELQRIKDISASPVLMSIHNQYHKQAITYFIAEVLYKTIREEETNKGLFEYLYHSILYFDTRESDISNFHLVFLTHLSRYLGFFPLNNYSETCNIFDALNGCFVTSANQNYHSYSIQISEKLHFLMNLNFENAQMLSLNRIERMELLNILLDYLGLHLHCELNIQSLKVLKEIFN